MTKELTVSDRQQLEWLVTQYTNDGYKVVSFSDRAAIVTPTGWGSVWVHLLLLFTTAGLGNIAYAILVRLLATRVRIVVTPTGRGNA